MNVTAVARKLTPSFLHSYLERLQASPVGWRMARGVFWSLVGTIISRGLAVASSIFVARILGRESFGEIGIIYSTVGMFGIFAGFGLGLTATKYLAEFRIKDPEKAGRILSLSGLTAMFTGGLMALLLFISAPWLAKKTLAAPHLSGTLRIATLYLFFNALNGAQTGSLSGFEAFKSIARVNFLAGLAYFPLVVGGCYLAGLNGAVWGMVAAMGVNWLLNHIALRVEARRFGIPFLISGCFREYRILYCFSLPTVLSGVMVGPVNWICSAMLVNQTNGYAEMGIFNAANQWRMAILFLPNIVSRITLPILSSLTGFNNKNKYNKTLLINMLINGIIAFAAAMFISLFSPLIMSIYGKGFSEGNYALIFLAFAAVCMAVNDVIGQAIASIGKVWNGFAFNLLWAILLICCAYSLLTRSYGATGLSLAILISYIGHSVWQGIYIYWFLKRGR
jgi:O-antigen/teichoic acid export membrane protein